MLKPATAPSGSAVRGPIGPLVDPLRACFAGRSLVLAVSGGGDSVALLALAAELRRRGCAFEAVVATVDHGLRPQSCAEAEWVATLSARLGFSHCTLVWSETKPASDLQAAARRARYALLARHAAAIGADAVVTAHSRDDQAETLLLRLAHGSGVDGLAAMAPARPLAPGIELLRPMLAVSRAELRAVAAAAGLDWLEDPSNADPRFARVRMRALMPGLAAEGMSAARLARTAARAGRAAAALEHAAAALAARAVTVDPAGFAGADAALLAAAPEEIAIRVLARLAGFAGGREAGLEAIEDAHAALFAAAAAGAPPRRRTLAGAVLERRGARLWAYREMRRPPPGLLVLAPGDAGVWDGRFRVALAAEAASDVVVGPLGPSAAGAPMPEAACGAARRPRVPQAAFAATPAVFCRSERVAVPGLAFYASAAWRRALSIEPLRRGDAEGVGALARS